MPRETSPSILLAVGAQATSKLVAPYGQDSLIDPKNHGCCDGHGGHECISAAVVARGDTAPVLDPTEHVFDFVALAVERGSVDVLDLRFWRGGMRGVMLLLTEATRNQSLS
jgi:hypothetical protein